MSRKERRTARPFGTAPGAGKTAGDAAADSPTNLFAAAAAQHQAGALAEAERRYRQILTLHPEHADSLHNLGLLALQTGNAASAVELMSKAIAVDDRVADYHYNIALAWRALKRLDNVATHLERAIELRPDHGLAHLNLGNVRREQGRPADALACYERAVALNPNSAAARVNLANALAEQGRWPDAIASYRHAVALDPKSAETHHRLGAALMTQGRYGEAVSHFENAIALRPDVAAGYEGLSTAYMLSGKLELAVHAISRALEINETPASRAVFSECVKSVRFTSENERLRKLVLRALSEGWARPREFNAVCISLIKLNPVVSECISRAMAAWPARLDAAELFGSSGLDALAKDEIFGCLLRIDPIADLGIECLLTDVRRAMLALARGGEHAASASHLKFYAAVARQCFINEYVYTLPQSEADTARDLQAQLTKALADGGFIPALWPVTVGAYAPLHTVSGAEALLQRSWPDDVAALLVQQIKEPMQERQIAAKIPTLTAIEDGVSRAVRDQYEANPYPRWVKAGPPFQPSILREGPQKPAAEVLIAGCGTGLSTVEFARHMPDARVLAIDLSLASLSYAQRMAQNFGVGNIEFAQADIMMLGSIGRQFDFIDSSGVLHHLGDPFAGWAILLSLLRPGGAMQVGLYSEAARRNVVAARTAIAARGFAPTPDGIRRCREHIMAADDALLKSIVQWEDFFTMSECRDLLFHVQEHRITLPQIKSFIAASDVQFAGFIQQPALLRRFVARFPEPAALLDLDCWHRLELEEPDVFSAMYQFWIRKPERPAATAAWN